MTDRPARLFHLAPLAAWQAQLESGTPEWSPASLASEGFVHLSFAHQLAGTLAVHFATLDELALLELDPERLPLAPRLERSRGGAPFPHLYAALPLEAVRATHVLRRRDGEFQLPDELAGLAELAGLDAEPDAEPDPDD